MSRALSSLNNSPAHVDHDEGVATRRRHAANSDNNVMINTGKHLPDSRGARAGRSPPNRGQEPFHGVDLLVRRHVEHRPTGMVDAELRQLLEVLGDLLGRPWSAPWIEAAKPSRQEFSLGRVISERNRAAVRRGSLRVTTQAA